MIRLEGSLVRVEKKHPNKKSVKGQQFKKIDYGTMLG